ncbi:DUF2357 domain-containing protein [Lysinibacillus sp. M3]|uniref:DUF2357 domain-containing protein n=1 Tax=Lysinibacillus zambalensis TaxID=3160866 RepID=A0ABV1N0I9_9BACI
MENLCAVSIETPNAKLLIAQSLKCLNNFHEIKNHSFQKDHFLVEIATRENGNLSYVTEDFSSFSLKEEHTYYLLYESNNPLPINIFINKFIQGNLKIYEGINSQAAVFQNHVVAEFKTQGQIGIWDFSTKELPELFFNVISTKLNFEKEYKYLISDIAQRVTELTTRYGNVNKLPFKENYEIQNNDYLESIILLNHMDEFLESLDLVIQFPYIKAAEELKMVPIGTQQTINSKDFFANPQNYDWVAEGAMDYKFNGYSPLKLNNINRYKEVDNYPNKFVKFVANYILDVLFSIKENLIIKISKDNERTNTYNKIRLTETEFYIEEIENRLMASFLSQVNELNYFSNTSQVLEKRLGYQEVLHFYNSLQNSINIDFETSTQFSKKYYSKPVAELYEIWCYLKIESLISEVISTPYNLKHNLIKTSLDRVTFTLKHGKKSEVEYLLLEQKKKIILYYNHEFKPPNKSYTISYKPDISIKIINLTNNEYTLHHFDSKYKIQTKDNSFKKEDIWKMHAYKDGIINSKSASILYPGSLLEYFYKVKSSECAEDIISPINAFPFRPGNDLDFEQVKEYLNTIL